MSFPDHYLLNVALHAGVLSLAVFVAVLLMRRPQRVAVTVLCGLLAIAVLPWFSALRSKDDPIADAPVAERSFDTALPQWTVVALPPSQAVREDLLVAAKNPVALPKIELPFVAASIWLGGSALLLIGLLRAVLKVLRWRRSLCRVDEDAWQAIREAGGASPPKDVFRISGDESGPCVVGFFKPLVAIPSFLLAPPKRREMRWVLRHEIRHWQGNDSRWSVILELVRVSQWWNPMVHLLIARWRMAREQVCDLAASEEDRESYGQFLVAMAARPSSGNRLAVTMVRRQKLRILRTRIVSLLEAAPGSGTPFEKGVLFSSCFALLGVALIVSGMKIGTTVSGGKGEEANGSWAGAQVEPLGGMAFAADEPVAEPGKVLQLKIQTKLFWYPADLSENGKVSTEAEMQQLTRELAQTKGTSLMMIPTVTMRVPETSFVELIRENPAFRPWNPDAGRSGVRKNRYAGHSLRLSSAMEEGKLRLSVDVGYGFVPDAHYSEYSKKLSIGEPEGDDVDWAGLVRRDGSASSLLNPGETMAIQLGEVLPGRHVTAFVTATPIDAIGQITTDFESAKYDLSPPLKGKAKLRGTLLILSKDTAADFHGDLPPSPSTMDRNLAGAFRKNENIRKVLELPAAVVPTDEFDVPWEEVKGLSLCVEMPADRSSASVRFRASGTHDTPPAGSPTTEMWLPKDYVAFFQVRPKPDGERHLLLLEVEAVE